MKFRFLLLFLILASIKLAGQNNSNDKETWDRILISAELMNYNGRNSQGIELLNKKIESENTNKAIKNLNFSKAYFLLADLYFSKNKIENFLHANDSAKKYLVIENKLLEEKYFLNRVRYYNYHALTAKAKPYLDTLIKLRNEFHLSDTINNFLYFISRINFFRNYDIKHLYPIVDSAKNFININYRCKFF